jgi:hypothetical protein
MGANNSSETRVVPVFDRLFHDDPTGATWLPGLLRLGSRASADTAPTDLACLVHGHVRTWGKNELSLPAPLALLEHLVKTINHRRVIASGDRGAVLAKRLALAQRDPVGLLEALNALGEGRRGRNWYVLEGNSRPDATLISSSVVLVIEGKCTERGCTSKTKWMGIRSQLVRHMDAASERFSGKRVLGLLIVEGDGGGEALDPSSYWEAESQAQYTLHMLQESLPHRTQHQRDAIANGILGVTTWQAICAQNHIPWPPSLQRPPSK